MVMGLQIVGGAYEMVVPASFLPQFAKHDVVRSQEPQDGDDAVPVYTYQYDVEIVSKGPFPISYVGAPEGNKTEKTANGYRITREPSSKIPRRELKFYYKIEDMMFPQLNYT
jgi:hypothetical protein